MGKLELDQLCWPTVAKYFRVFKPLIIGVLLMREVQKKKIGTKYYLGREMVCKCVYVCLRTNMHKECWSAKV